MPLHGVLMNGSVWNNVVGGLRDRYRCIVPELPFGAHRRPMPDGTDLSLGSIARHTPVYAHSMKSSPRSAQPTSLARQIPVGVILQPLANA